MDDTLSGEFILKQEKPNSVSVSGPSARHGHKHSLFPDIRKHSLGFASSLCIDPNKVRIISQDEDEVVHLLVRRHHITSVPALFFVFVVFLIPIVFPLIIPMISFLQISGSTVISFLSLYYLALFGYVLLKFSEWYFHVGLISNKRLIDIDMENILSKNFAETTIASVQDVEYTQKGVLQSLFNYGTVEIQNEAVEQNFEYDNIPHPSQVAELINELAETAKEEEKE
jgi:hypothetical protein